MGSLLLGHPLALIALVAGYVLLVVEMCVPGFGAPGILGTILAVLGLIAMQPAPVEGLILVIVYVLLLLIALLICMRSLSRGRLSKSRLVLSAVSTRSEPGGDGDLSRFAGKTGTAHTPLRPAGIAELDGVRLNVVTEGDYIEQGAPLRVVRADGNRVVVAVDKRESH